MKKINSTLILFLILMSLFSNAQVTVFRTFEDFQNEEGEMYDDYHSYLHKMGAVTLKFINDKNKVKIHCDDMWGFIYKDVLFRIDKRTSQPTRVINSGKIIYYENGIAHLGMIRDNTTKGSFSIGYYCYLSKDINSEMVPFPTTLISDARKKINNFKLDNPEYNELFDCIEKNYNYQNVRICTVKFEESE